MTFQPYWVVLVASFLVVGLWEARTRRRALITREEARWPAHAALTAIGVGALWLLVPVSSIVVARAVASNPLGLLNKEWLPAPVAWGLAVVLLDLGRYLVHYAHHRVPALWRLHSVHHSDPDLDLTTGLRHHPLEFLLIQGTHIVLVACLAPPPSAVILAECLFCVQSLLSHANARMPVRFERPLRRWLITPDLHQVHHSDRPENHDRNFGDLFVCWDRLFRTYRESPAPGAPEIVPGMPGLQNPRSIGLWFMLTLPFVRHGAPVDGELIATAREEAGR